MEKFNPKEKANFNKERILSDAEKINKGTDVTPEGQIIFTEDQVKSAR